MTDGVFIRDVPLLDTLVTEDSTSAAKAAQKEGWKWVEVHPGLRLPAKSEFHVALAMPSPSSTAKKQNELETLQRNTTQLE